MLWDSIFPEAGKGEAVNQEIKFLSAAKRIMKAPFLVNNTLPDKILTDFIETHNIENAIEFGCGEGRNAIYLAQNGVDIIAIDSSSVAIKNAEENKQDLKNVKFVCSDFLSFDFNDNKYDLVIDSGMFHHLAPHSIIVG